MVYQSMLLHFSKWIRKCDQSLIFCRFGGIGGKGGDVVATATPDITLENVYKQNRSKSYRANNGKHSTHNFIIGPSGEDLKIPVPVGVSLCTELGKRLGQ